MTGSHAVEIIFIFFNFLADPPPVVLEDRFELLVGGQGLRVVASMASSRRWRAACRQFDSCAGSGGQARRRRQSMCGGDERQELHHSNLAFGNACSVCLAQRLSTARPHFAARVLAATACARPERRTSTDRVGSAKATVFK